jgi:hypothetical protein
VLLDDGEGLGEGLLDVVGAAEFPAADHDHLEDPGRRADSRDAALWGLRSR